jgi:ribosome-binding protein aMBF1 (putative translation factor)
MLAVVKKPRIELSISGKDSTILIDWIRKKFDLTIVSNENDESVNIEDTDFYKEMNSNRIGNLLEASRLKAGLTQKQLAEKTGITQNMISDYEHGRRKLTKEMSARLAKTLHIRTEHLQS